MTDIKSSTPLFEIHIISDGTGETALNVVQAVLVQYKANQARICRHHNVRSAEQAKFVIKNIENKNNCLLVFTLALQEMRHVVYQNCKELNIKCVDIFSPLFKYLEGTLDAKDKKQPGLLRNVDEDYFKRIEATEYSIRHDDGRSINRLKDADIVLVGVSRTSKTPLSIYLSFKGWKVANIPLVLGIPLPEDLKLVDNRRIIGLTIDIDNLIRIRKNRLKKLGWQVPPEYADKMHIIKEMEYAREIFAKYKWPVLNVTDRALEETANEILYIIRARLGLS